MATKYNPYNAVKNISELKGKYHTAKDMGEDPEKYHTEAMKWYNELDANGYADIADELSMVDYSGSLDILGRYKPDTEFAVDSYYEDLQSSSASKPTYSAENEVGDDYIETLLGIGTGSTTPKTSDTVNSILDSFKNTDEKLNGEIKYDENGNVVSGLNIDHYNTGKDQLDYINNFDYTKQSYYDPIMDSYNLLGDNASRGELASGASTNSGNIDSYAAANANRQQLAFTNAGHEAARAAAQQNQENWQTLYDAMSGNLSDMGAINSQNLATASNFYATESAERQNALALSAQLANDKATRELEQYLAELEDAIKRHEIDSTTATNMAQQALDKYYAELQDAQLKYEYDMQATESDKQREHEINKLIEEITGQKQLMAEEYRLADEYGYLLGNTETEEETEEAKLQTMYRDMADLVNMLNNNEDESIKSYTDVYNAMIEQYPEYEQEIRTYINFIKNTASDASNAAMGDLISALLNK